MSELPPPSTKTPRDRRERARLAAAGILGGAAAALALANLDTVSVSWVFSSTRLPLIVLIVVVFLLGVAADRAFGAHRRRRGEQGPD